jgi:hypothetical protein
MRSKKRRADVDRELLLSELQSTDELGAAAKEVRRSGRFKKRKGSFVLR